MSYETRRLELSTPSFNTHSKELRETVEFIDRELKKKVYVIGSNALYEYGLPVWRSIEDVDIYAPLTLGERSRVIKYIREKQKSKHSSLTGLKLHLIGDTITKFITPVRENSWDERTIQLKGCKVYLPSLEDLILLKLISPRVKDRQDAERALLLGREKIDSGKLTRKQEKVRKLQYLT